MSNLISGKEALIALANGEDIEFKMRNGTWRKVQVGDLLGHWELRLKPRTIIINDIEVPAPFEPKDGDIYYFINSSNLKGYGFNKFANDGDDECLTFYGAWRTEEEIKQVVAALRSIFSTQGK